MHLNVGHKIFGIAIVVLVLMATVAFYSVKLTARISGELDTVASKQLPLSDSIGRINVRILEQGLLIQRFFALPDSTSGAEAEIKRLGEQVRAEFARARALFVAEEHDPNVPATIKTLHAALDEVEREYLDFEKHGLALIGERKAGDLDAFRATLPHLNRQQNAVDREIDDLRRHVEALADESVKRADREERFLLGFNATMTVLSALLGLGIAALVTYVLVRNIRNLVRATEEVDAGDLDIEVPVATRDEVGRLARSFNGMVDGLRMKERIKDTFGKYMDQRIVANLLENPELTQLGGSRREMTVMFIDLEGYTSISERLEPQDLVHMLNMFLGQMVDAISAHNGVVNDFLGDAVMAYWGPPFTTHEEQAQLACQAALEALENFEKFRADVNAELGQRAEGLKLNMRVGISSGDMVAGNIGSTATRKFSVIGDPVNLGARLEGANKNYGTRIIISERTRDLAGTHIQVREIDQIRVKGKSEPTRIFQLLAEADPSAQFSTGLAAYRRQDWSAARAAFQACHDDTPDDPVPAVFLERVAHLSMNPPGADWDGVWTFETK